MTLPTAIGATTIMGLQGTLMLFFPLRGFVITECQVLCVLYRFFSVLLMLTVTSGIPLKKILIVLASSMFAFHFIVPHIGSVGVIFNCSIRGSDLIFFSASSKNEANCSSVSKIQYVFPLKQIWWRQLWPCLLEGLPARIPRRRRSGAWDVQPVVCGRRLWAANHEPQRPEKVAVQLQLWWHSSSFRVGAKEKVE